MGFYTFLEVDSGKVLPIHDENNVNVGTPLVAFLSTYISTSTQNKKSKEFIWFSKLENQANINIQIITQILYDGNWSNSSTQSKKYFFDWETGNPISVTDIEKILINMWAPVEQVILTAEKVIRILPTMGEDTHWYSSQHTMAAFKALLNALKEAQTEGGKDVRIQVF